MKLVRCARLWLLLSMGACAVDAPPPIVPRAEASQAAPGTWTPTIDAPVVDLSGRVSDAAEARITRSLEAHRVATRVQVAVLIVDTLGGEAIEDFSLRVAEAWGGGSSARDDGLLVTFAAADRRMRIEVGYGLEAQVPDALAKQFLDDAKPDLRAGDWDAAVEGVVRRLVAQTANGAPSPANYVPRAVREARKGQATVALGLLAAVVAVFAGYATGLGFRPEGSKRKTKGTRRKKGNRRKTRPAPSGRRRVAYRLAWPALLLVLFALVRVFGLTAWTLAPSLVYGLLALPFGLDSEKFVTALKFFAGFGMVMGLGPALAVGLGAGAADGGLAAFAGIGLFTGLMGLAASGADASSGGGSSYSSSHSSSSTSYSTSPSTSYGASSSSSSYSGGGGSFGGGGASSSW